MDITINLDTYIRNSGNLFKCIFKRTTIMQARIKSFDVSTIIQDKVTSSMEELINDTLTLQMETEMKYEGGFPHSTYWSEIKLYLEKYKEQPWELYRQTRNQIGNGSLAAYLQWYAIGVTDDLRTLETWASEVRIY